MSMDYGSEAIKRHRASRGKVSIASKMAVETLDDLSIAYTPGWPRSAWPSPKTRPSPST